MSGAMMTSCRSRSWLHLVLVLAWLLAAALPSTAAPVAWPDGGTPGNAPANPDSGWTPWKSGGGVVYDPAGGSPGDPSNGGTQPNSYVDVVSAGGTKPSCYWAYDAANQVAFFRFRLFSDPNTNQASNPRNYSNTDPFFSATWNVLLDINGDGYLDWVVTLDGTSGTSGSPFDNLNVGYNANTKSNSIPSTLVYTTKATNVAQYSEVGTTYLTVDNGYTRRIRMAANEWYIDVQVPLSAFRTVLGGGSQLLFANTPVSLAFGTSNNANNPFQKDAVYNGAYTPATNKPYTFGDPITFGGGDLPPQFTQITATCNRPDTLGATALDGTTVDVSGNVKTLVTKVEWYYQASPADIKIGEATTPTAGTLATYSIPWNNSALPSGTYNIYAKGYDSAGRTFTSSTIQCVFAAPPVVKVDLSGTVYNDANFNLQKDTSEVSTGVNGLYVKLVQSGGTVADAAAAVDPVTGAYSFSQVDGNITYELILDTNNTLSDITPTAPTGWVGTAPATLLTQRTTTTANITGIDFGLFSGSRLQGTVFIDSGAGGGTPNDGIQNGSEPGSPGVEVALTAGASVLATATTGSDGGYMFFIPVAQANAVLSVVKSTPVAYKSTGGSAGTTASSGASDGTFTLATNTVTFTYKTAVSSYTDVDFGHVPMVELTTDNQITAQPGTTVLFPHSFVAHSAGSVTFSIAASAEPPGTPYTRVLYLDVNGDGTVDPSDTVISGPVAVAADEVLHLLIKEMVPTSAAAGARDALQLTAAFTYQGSGLTTNLTRTDLLTVGASGSVALVKSVDKASAAPGEQVVYTITYTNHGSQAVTSFLVHDVTPAFTTLVSTGFTLGAGLTGCSVTSPNVGSEGDLTWTFTGSLQAGATGTVTFTVQVK